MTSMLLQRATLVHDDVTSLQHDVHIVDGVIADVQPTGTIDVHTDGGERSGADVTETIDLGGHLLLPAAVEPHAHLDKAFLAERAPNLTGDLLGAIDAMIAVSGTIDLADQIERAERAARLMAANGYVAVRSHTDVTVHSGLRNTEALIEVRRRLRDLIDIEVVALTGGPVVGVAGADHRALVRAALDMGADLVGGCPHLEDDLRIEEATDILLGIAVEAGVGVDLHTDETLDPTILGLEYLARAVLDGFPHRVTASHCVSLGQVSARDQQRISALVAEANIGVVTLPHTNLWLQGRGQEPVPRGLTAIGALRAEGVAVAAGADNLQDPFNPLGRACPFDTAGLMVLAAHDLPATAWAAVSTDARSVLGLADGSIAPGSPADLLAVPASSLRSAIATGPVPRRVWRRGRELVRTGG
jgi:cytosine/creatinine deaminase